MSNIKEYIGSWLGTTLALTGAGAAPSFFAGMIGGRFFEARENVPYESLQGPSALASGIGGAIIVGIFTLFLYPALKDIRSTNTTKPHNTRVSSLKFFGALLGWLIFVTIASVLGNLIQTQLDRDRLPLGKQAYVSLTGAALIVAPIALMWILALSLQSCAYCKDEDDLEAAENEQDEPDGETNPETIPLLQSIQQSVL